MDLTVKLLVANVFLGEKFTEQGVLQLILPLRKKVG